MFSYVRRHYSSHVDYVYCVYCDNHAMEVCACGVISVVCDVVCNVYINIAIVIYDLELVFDAEQIC